MLTKSQKAEYVIIIYIIYSYPIINSSFGCFSGINSAHVELQTRLKQGTYARYL